MPPGEGNGVQWYRTQRLRVLACTVGVGAVLLLVLCPLVAVAHAQQQAHASPG